MDFSGGNCGVVPLSLGEISLSCPCVKTRCYSPLSCDLFFVGSWACVCLSITQTGFGLYCLSALLFKSLHTYERISYQSHAIDGFWGCTNITGSCHRPGAWVISPHHYLSALDEFQRQPSLDTAHGRAVECPCGSSAWPAVFSEQSLRASARVKWRKAAMPVLHLLLG